MTSENDPSKVQAAAPVTQSSSAFEEKQRFGPGWVWAVVIVSALVCIVFGVLSAIPAAGGPEILADTPRGAGAGWGLAIGLFASGVLLVVLFLIFSLHTRVTDENVEVRFFPFPRRRIAYGDIATCESRTYQPLKEYGGWGIRIGPGGKAYNISGDKGVQLTLQNGVRVLIGSQRADDLATAIQDRLKSAR